MDTEQTLSIAARWIGEDQIAVLLLGVSHTLPLPDAKVLLQQLQAAVWAAENS